MDLKILDLFSGIGGFSYAAERIVGGYKTTQFVEVDPYCQSVLRKNFPNTPIHDDIRTFSAKSGQFDVFTIGFPCQDLSVAGKQRGINEQTRSGLFYESIRLLREVRPRFALFENVRNLLSHEKGETFQEVLFQIAKAGYNAEWSVVSAKDLGACHLRERVWIIAYTNDYGQQRREHETCNQDAARKDTQVEWTTNTTDIERSSDDGFFNQKPRINENLSRSSDGRKTTSTNTRTVCELYQGTDNNKRISSQDIYQENNDRTLVSKGQSRVQLSNRGKLGRNQTTFEDNSIRYGDDNDSKQGMDNQRSNVTNSDSNGSSPTERLRINGKTNTSSQEGENEVSKFKRGSESKNSGIVQQTAKWTNTKNRLNPNWRGYISKPTLRRGDDGLSNRVARIRAMGNSIVPCVAAIPLQRIKDLNQEKC